MILVNTSNIPNWETSEDTNFSWFNPISNSLILSTLLSLNVNFSSGLKLSVQFPLFSFKIFKISFARSSKEKGFTIFLKSTYQNSGQFPWKWNIN